MKYNQDATWKKIVSVFHGYKHKTFKLCNSVVIASPRVGIRSDILVTKLAFVSPCRSDLWKKTFISQISYCSGIRKYFSMLLITKSIVSIPEQTKNSSEQAENTYILVPVQFQCSVADVKQLCFSACVPGTWLEWFNQRNPASLLRIFSSSWHCLFIFLLNCSFNPWKQSNDEGSFM